MVELFVGQHNAQIHLLAVVIVISIGFVLGISSDEWLIIILTMAMVVMAEALNTAIEYLADACMPEHHPLIEKAKDIGCFFQSGINTDIFTFRLLIEGDFAW